MRRGQSTANMVWGNEASVLTGDFLYSRAFEMMVEVGGMRVMEILAKTTNTIAEGEVLQLLNCHDPEVTEENYLRVIYSKTAKLFEAAARLGAVISDQPPAIEAAMAKYGMHLGTAFQLVDDMLDYTADSRPWARMSVMIWPRANPRCRCCMRCVPAVRRKQPLRAAIEQGGLDRIEEVVAAIESTGANAYTARKAEDEARCAAEVLTAIPESPYKQALLDLARFSVHRTY